MVIPVPPSPFPVDKHVLVKGTSVYRVFDARSGRRGNEPNPGYGDRTRFAFFPIARESTGPASNPAKMPPGQCRSGMVPVLYAASGIKAAVNESILHDVPRSGGALLPGDYAHHVAVRLRVERDLRLASFIDDVDRRLDMSIRDVTEIFESPDPDEYGETVKWAETAYREGFDGCVWMTQRFNSQAAYVFFGDRVASTNLAVLSDQPRVFGTPHDRNWLTDMCAPLNIEVRW